MAITLTYTFSAGTRIQSAQVNSNFSTLATRALDKTGDTITGNIAVDNGITIDGLDLSAAIANKVSTATITGAWTFDLDPSAPFVVSSGSAKVSNLDADKWDGQDLPADPNADRILFWDDSAGTIQYLTAGTGLSISGTTITNSATLKPWQVFTPNDNQPPASGNATQDTRNNHIVLDFDAAASEDAIFGSVLPHTYAGGGLSVMIVWAASSATSGNVRWEASIERLDDGGENIGADDFANAKTEVAAAPGESGVTKYTTFTFSAGAEMDGLAAGEAFRLRIRRNGGDGSDTMTGDAELLRVTVREP